MKRFAEKSFRIDRVDILTVDAESTGGRQYETTKGQREELERRWKTSLAGADLRLTQRSKRAGGDLHDRFVRAHLAGGDRIVWDIAAASMAS